MIKVSVIVPVYNVEPYLTKCLDSLVHQTLKEIEIIVVNDGSTDHSQAIIDSFSRKYDCVKAYQKENGGLSDARNYGMQFASGEYIGFLDSDDFVDTNMYELLYQKAKETGSEICECNLHHTFASYEDTEIGAIIEEPKEMLMNGRSVVWNKIYQREWLEQTGVKFHKGIIYEDVEFFCKLVPFIHQISYIPEACVHYVQRGNSINNKSSKKTLDILTVLQEITVFYQEHGFYEEYREALEFFYARILLCSSFSRMCRIPDKEIRKEALSSNWEFLTNAYPNWKKNPYVRASNSKKMMFARTMNTFTYALYGKLLPVCFRMKEKGKYT